MRTIVDALNEASNLALLLINISNDKDIVRVARNVVEKSNLACDRIIELRGDKWPDIASTQKQPTTDASAPTKP